ncbi:MAG: hypothetical protein HJJLKODD_01564 [Phycisphaerae bacterium]|nr:hypothetical protein [Phycisphaerae bacterium]
MTLTSVLIDQLQRTREWTLKLLQDISGTDWTYQINPGAQHVLWLCGHLATSQDTLLFQRCLQREVLDPEFRRHFPIGGPIRSRTEYGWPAPELVLQKMADMQQSTISAIREIDPAILQEPAFGAQGSKHPHYDTKIGAINHMNRHEAFHAGQMALIRRMLGKQFLR